MLEQWRNRQPDAFERIRHRHPKYRRADDATLAAAPFRLNDAQLVIAREYGFAHWTALKQRVEGNSPVQALDAAIRADDRGAAVRLAQTKPEMLHVPVTSGNWGPPMSHAANMGPAGDYQSDGGVGRARFSARVRSRDPAGTNRVRALAAGTWRQSDAKHDHGRVRNPECGRLPLSHV